MTTTNGSINDTAFPLSVFDKVDFSKIVPSEKAHDIIYRNEKSTGIVVNEIGRNLIKDNDAIILNDYKLGNTKLHLINGYYCDDIFLIGGDYPHTSYLDDFIASYDKNSNLLYSLSKIYFFTEIKSIVEFEFVEHLSPTGIEVSTDRRIAELMKENMLNYANYSIKLDMKNEPSYLFYNIPSKDEREFIVCDIHVMMGIITNIKPVKDPNKVLGHYNIHHLIGVRTLKDEENIKGKTIISYGIKPLKSAIGKHIYIMDYTTNSIYSADYNVELWRGERAYNIKVLCGTER